MKYKILLAIMILLVSTGCFFLGFSIGSYLEEQECIQDMNYITEKCIKLIERNKK